MVHDWKINSETYRSKDVCMVAFSSSSHMEKDRWYFDSGCSAHMTGDSKLLTQIRPVIKKQFVTFGDGGKERVIGCGTLKVPDLPVLKDTLLVDGLKVNLISIRSRAANNCYLIGSTGTGAAPACMSSQADEMSLWHRRLGHLNLKTLKKLCSSGLIRGMPNVKGNQDVVCGECQIGK
ncbi:unnamed protein product [Rhodiola kirilowii]